jgi:hypothetical protein
MLVIYEWDYLDKEPLPQRQRLYKNSVIMTLSPSFWPFGIGSPKPSIPSF